MSDEPNTPKVNPAEPTPAEKTPQPPAGKELPNEALDKVTGGLLPAV
jgi:hypothetical protein